MHANARFTHWDRQELVRRVLQGRPVAHVAVEMNVSRPTATKWWSRYRDDPGGSWWLDRSIRPRNSPNQTRPKIEKRLLGLRSGRPGWSAPWAPSTPSRCHKATASTRGASAARGRHPDREVGLSAFRAGS